MNNRLQQFLDLENLTPAKLADMIGVQRSGLSHILSGRNNPSYDFITRLLSKFPHINSDWLLMGKGKPYRDFNSGNLPGSPLPSPHFNGNSNPQNNLHNNFQSNQQNGIPYNGISYNSLLNNNVQNNGIPSNSIQGNSIPYNNVQLEDSPILDDSDELNLDATLDTNSQSPTHHVDLEDFNPNFNTSQPSENCVKGQSKATDVKKRKIKRVIIFYNDGSFEELFPHIR